MKKALLSVVICLFTTLAFSQDKMGPAEKEMTDSVCSCLARADLSVIKTQQQAVGVITDCFTHRTDLMMAVAEEKHVDITDNEAMKGIGRSIGKDLLKENCDAFGKLSAIMAKAKMDNDADDEGFTSGRFVKIELKGFNYIVLTDANGNEKSFLWLKQFAGSEKFMNGGAAFAGKRIKVKWQEEEIFLPQAKGYYKVKEITGIEFL